MSSTKKHRKCPHCGSTRGFKVSVSLGGTHDFEVSFSGKILDSVREGTDNMEDDGYCLDCDKRIPIEKLDTRNV